MAGRPRSGGPAPVPDSVLPTIAAEGRLSYASLGDLLADVDDEVLNALPDPQRRAIDFVLLRAPAGPAVTDHRAVGAAVLSILGRLADDAAVLVAVDDLQWGDASGSRAIEFALRRLSARAGLLAALRTSEGGDRGLPVRLHDPERVSRITVGPLSLGACTRCSANDPGGRSPGPCRRGSSRCPEATRSMPSNSRGGPRATGRVA